MLKKSELRKEIPYTTDPDGMFQLFAWISFQRQRDNPSGRGMNEHPAFYYIFKYFARLTRLRESKDEKNLFIRGDSGIGKTWSTQWMYEFLDHFTFSLDTNGCGKFEGAVAHKIGLCDEVPKEIKFVQHNQGFSALLNILGGTTATIKVFGGVKETCHKIQTIFTSNYAPEFWCPQLLRRLQCVETNRTPVKIKNYSSLLVYNYFYNSREYIEKDTYPCICASLTSDNNKWCSIYNLPEELNCTHYNKLIAHYNMHNRVDYSILGEGFDPWDCYNNINCNNISDINVTAPVIDVSNRDYADL